MQLIGNSLGEGSADILPDFCFSGEGSDGAVLIDVQPSADILRNGVVEGAVAARRSGFLRIKRCAAR
jgi:hypothetical protein